MTACVIFARLLGRFALAGAQIPCYGVLIGFKLRIERLAGRNRRDGVIELAARFFGIPALECVSGFHRRSAGRSRCRIRLYSFTVRCFAVNGAAVCACIPCNCQRNRCTAVVALSVAVCVHMIRVFIGGRLADRAGFGSLVLCFAGA